MTEIDLLTEAVAVLQQIRFCVHVCAFALCWLAGAYWWKFFIYAKNHRDIW